MHNRILYKKLFFRSLELLPYNMRFRVNKSLYRNKYSRAQNLRTKVAKIDETSLKGFDELKCIYVHIPKVAGISINRALFGNLGGSHRSIFDYSLIFKQSEFNSYYKFTFVRNPWDRILSAYLFLKAGGVNEFDEYWSKKYLSRFSSFQEFVTNWVNKKNIEKEMHFIPQYKFISINNKIAVDDIYKLETITYDFSVICRKLGIENRLQVLNRNKNKNKNYRDSYNDDTKNIVAEVYKKDIETFNYQF